MNKKLPIKVLQNNQKSRIKLKIYYKINIFCMEVLEFFVFLLLYIFLKKNFQWI